MSLLIQIMSVFGSATGTPSDPDPGSYVGKEYDVTRSYATANELTTDETNYLLLFTKSLVDAGAYHDVIMFNPLLGSRVLNMVDPENTDDAYRLTGDITPHAKGISLTTSDIVDTNCAPIHLAGRERFWCGSGIYVQSVVNKVIDTTNNLYKHTYYDPSNSNKAYVHCLSESNGVVITTGLKGHWLGFRRDDTYVDIYNEGVLVGSDYRPTSFSDTAQPPTETIKLIPSSDVVVSCVYHVRTLTNAKAVAFDAALQTLMSNLGRHV